MARLSGWMMASSVFFLCGIAAIVSPAQTFTTLVNFNRSNGAYPEYMSLAQGADGNFYGTTSAGGINRDGTIIRITPKGDLRFHSFCTQFNCTYGSGPFAGLVLGTNGRFYGTAGYGGAHNSGTIFAISAAGTPTLLYSFCAAPKCADGSLPQAGMVPAADGMFYGTTTSGGAFDSGTIFKSNAKGMLTSLYSFCVEPKCADGDGPVGRLVQGVDGNFYGTTTVGGNDTSSGTVFRMTPGGILTTLYRFCAQPGCTDGSYPHAGLIQGSDGNFYGTTSGGPNTYGTVFEMTPEGSVTTLYTFCPEFPCPDGGVPIAGLIQATDGNFYGTTSAYGSGSGGGTVFKITPAGALTTLYSFCSQGQCADGMDPFGALTQGTDGSFYGTTLYGGTYDFGTVFSLNVGLGPFVAFVRSYGKVGQTGGILGQGFTGTTSVLLNGTPASFTVVSDTYIRATVPAGATTGYVTVTTPSGTLTSNVPFHVIP